MTVDASVRRGVPPVGLLLVTAAASGAAVMVVETTAVRTLQPFFGSTTHVWSNVIAVTLGALALGYLLGGRIADRRPAARLVFAAVASGGVLVALSALLVTPVSQLFLAEGLDLEGMPTALWKGSLGASLLVFAPPMLLLGATSPLVIRLLAAGGVGRAAGRVYALSTAASVAGTYAATLVLVPCLGSRGSLVLAAAAAVVPAAAGLGLTGGRRSAVCAAAAALAVGATAACDLSPGRAPPVFRNGGVARVLEERESAYQYLTVREDSFESGEVDLVLTLNEGVYSFHSLQVQGQVLTSSRHYDDYAVLPMLLGLPAGSELRMGVVGFACGVNAAQWRHFWDGPFRLRVEGAEIDPEVVDLGRRWFGLAPQGDPVVRVVVADGRTWLASLPPGPRFHVLLVDAFANEIYLPFHVGTREFLELCRSRLAPGGLVAMNVYAVGAQAPNLAALESTIAEVFGGCARSSRYGANGFLLIAQEGRGAPDLSALQPSAILQQFGEREGMAEWDRLVDLAGEVAATVTTVTPHAGGRVLTDDDAPLEYLTDRFIAETEAVVLGADALAPEPVGEEDAQGADLARRRAAHSGRLDALRELARRQDHLLVMIGAGWAAVLVACLLAVRRVEKGPVTSQG